MWSRQQTWLGSFAVLFLPIWVAGCGATSAPRTNSLALIVTSTLQNGVVSQGYNANISATGGAPPYTWSATSGALPPGLSLSATGVLTGIPTAAGWYSFTATVTDAKKLSASQTLTIPVEIQISPNSCMLFISPTGSDSNPGTMAAPWQTLQHAFNTVKAGQIVCLRGGTYPMTVSTGYNQSLTTSGTPQSPITFTNSPGEVAIIHGNTRIQSSDVDFIGTPPASLPAGLVFEGPTNQPLGLIDLEESQQLLFDHIEIRGDDYHAGFYEFGGSDIQLVNSYIHDNGRPGFTNTDNGVYWDATTGGGNLVANNVIEHNVAQGIQLFSAPTDVVVEQNTIVNNGSWAALYGSGNAFVNNIVADNGGSPVNPQIDVEGSNYTLDSNLIWNSNASQLGWVADPILGVVNTTSQMLKNLLASDPLFVDPANHNYHLQPGSPALAAGDPVFTMSTDHDGVTRASPPTIGPYQH